jgi:uncharacterized glyoxalase superfamily protein PhnB
MNEFDTLGEYDDELGGFFKKIRKRVKKRLKHHKRNFKRIKKVVKKVNHVRRKVRRKFHPKFLRKFEKKASKNKVVRGVALAVGSIYLGPAMGALMGGGGFAGAAAAMKGVALKSALAKAALKKLATKGASKLVKRRYKKRAKKKNKKIANAMKKRIAEKQLRYKNHMLMLAKSKPTQKELLAAKALDAKVNRIGASPEYREVIASYKAQGLTNKQIIQKWGESQSFKNIALHEGMKVAVPQLYRQYRQQGMPAQEAQAMAMQEGARLTEVQVAKTSGAGDMGKILAIGIPVALALVMGA